MPIELTMLALAVALLFVIILIQATIGVLDNGLMPMANSRDGLPDPSPRLQRAKRVVDNHREGLLLFAPLVLVAALTNNFDANTALGAQIFLYARVAHAVWYLAGLPYIRPLFWAIGIVGTGMIGVSLFD